MILGQIFFITAASPFIGATLSIDKTNLNFVLVLQVLDIGVNHFVLFTLMSSVFKAATNLTGIDDPSYVDLKNHVNLEFIQYSTKSRSFS